MNIYSFSVHLYESGILHKFCSLEFRLRMVNFSDNGEAFEELICTSSSDHTPAVKFLAAFNIILSILASTGNVLVLLALRKESSLHPSSKILLHCLAITDLCVGAIEQPMVSVLFVAVVNDAKDLCRPMLGFSFLSGVVLFGVSLLTLTAVSVDRLLALLLGLRFRQLVTWSRVLAVVICFWVLNIVIAVLCSWNYIIFLWYGCVLVLSCIITSVFSYAKIFTTLLRRQALVHGVSLQGQQTQVETPLNIARYRKSVFGALWIQGTLLCCYLPYFVVTALASFIGLTPSVVLGWRFTTSIVFLNSSLNPFLYCWKIREVRQAVKETIRRCLCSSD